MIRSILHLFIRSLPLLAIILIIFEIVATNEFASVGTKIRTIDVAIDRLRDENELLHSQIASASALIAIEQKAKDLGYKIPADFITMGQETVALNPH